MSVNHDEGGKVEIVILLDKLLLPTLLTHYPDRESEEMNNLEAVVLFRVLLYMKIEVFDEKNELMKID